MCAIITSCTLLPCNFTLMAALNTGVAPSNLAQLQCRDAKEQRQCRYDDARMTESGKSGSEQLLVMPTEQLTG